MTPNHLTNPALEWFFAQQDVTLYRRYEAGWRLHLFRDNGEGHESFAGTDPIALIEDAYEVLYLEPARRMIAKAESSEVQP